MVNLECSTSGTGLAERAYMAQLLAMGVRQFSKQDDRGIWMITQEVVDWVMRMLSGDLSAAQEDEKEEDEEVDETTAAA